jgi:hypothetical protein
MLVEIETQSTWQYNCDHFSRAANHLCCDRFLVVGADNRYRAIFVEIAEFTGHVILQ